MPTDPVISVRNVSKAYRMWESPTARILSPLQASLGMKKRAAKSYRDFWALKDISFEVQKGEAVGIIGRNGSGKSTLLQIIAGTLQPTEGEVHVNGRVAALLELGSGFNPLFTGRENVYLNSTVLGLSRQQVDERFDAIAAFADIGDFIDQPVKTYSSGMVVRLAFAVQIQLQPDLLIIDEALSVGDEAFQRKCFARIGQMRDHGVTILFVSHSSSTVVAMCQRVVLLDHGRRILTASPKEAIQYYNKICYAPVEALPGLYAEIAKADSRPATNDQIPSSALHHVAATISDSTAAYYLENLHSESRTEFPPRGALIVDLQIQDAENRRVNVLANRQNYTLRLRVVFAEPAALVRFGWTAKSLAGVDLAGAATHPPGKGFNGFDAGQEIEVCFSFCNLFNHGTYFINVAVRAQLEEPDMIIHGLADALMFKIQPTPDRHRNGFMDCTVEPAWSIREISTSPDPGAVTSG